MVGEDGRGFKPLKRRGPRSWRSSTGSWRWSSSTGSWRTSR